MAKVLITGMSTYKFENDKKELVDGMSIYYKKQLNSDRGNVGRGYTSEKISIKNGNELYNKMVRQTYDKPFEAELKYELSLKYKKLSHELVDIQF